MTQNADTADIVNHLMARIGESLGSTRDAHVTRLLVYVPIELVSMLVGASNRYQHASDAFLMADADMARKVTEIRTTRSSETRDSIDIDRIVVTAHSYVTTLQSNNGDEIIRARNAFTHAVDTASDAMNSVAGRESIALLATMAVSTAMAFTTRNATEIGLRQIRTAIVKDHVARFAPTSMEVERR